MIAQLFIPLWLIPKAYNATMWCVSVLRRLVTLLSREAHIEAESEALKRQAESATKAAQQMMEEKDTKQNKVRLTYF